MTTFKIRTTFGTQTTVQAASMIAAICQYCRDWAREETTILSIERI